MTETYFNTARLARDLKLHQSHVQQLIKTGKIEAPDILLRGIGTRPPQAGYKLTTIKRIISKWEK